MDNDSTGNDGEDSARTSSVGHASPLGRHVQMSGGEAEILSLEGRKDMQGRTRQGRAGVVEREKREGASRDVSKIAYLIALAPTVTSANGVGSDGSERTRTRRRRSVGCGLGGSGKGGSTVIVPPPRVHFPAARRRHPPTRPLTHSPRLYMVYTRPPIFVNASRPTRILLVFASLLIGHSLEFLSFRFLFEELRCYGRVLHLFCLHFVFVCPQKLDGGKFLPTT
ncbi:hypothetical protein BGY98DRAFT_933820 [Russula aff. rugulosa BPL654]|nr:hypothetical protein BGY98DRAFT_933820 [Russula aff. rugulosa BPL654]